MKTTILKKIIVFCFILVPLLSSLISTIHLVDLFALGNPSWISYTVAIAIEVGAVASFLTLSILSKLNKGIVWGMFTILFLMQIIGNVYFSYDWITKRIAQDPNWVKNFKEMLEFFFYEIDEKTSKMILSMLIGIPIPLISVFLLKSTTDYLGTDSEIVIDMTAPEEISETILATPDVDVSTSVEESEIEKKTDEDQIHITDTENTVQRKRAHPSRVS